MNSSLCLLFKSLPLLLQGAAVTLLLACIAGVLGLCGGILVGTLNSQRLQKPILTPCLTGFVWLIRGTPVFVQVLLIYYALPEVTGISLSPFTAGILALSINSTAYISEIIRGGINALPVGQWEAAYVTGLTTKDTLQGIIFPQVLRHALPSLTNELVTLVKETSVLMIIGVAELTKVGKDIVARELDPMTIYLAAAALYLCMTSGLSSMTHYLQKRGAL